MKFPQNIFSLALPPSVRIDTIYTNFMCYLLDYTKKYVEIHVLDGTEVWKTYHSSMDIVLVHPNGWGTAEQGVICKSTVVTGYVDTVGAVKRIKFVTEAEASVHFCIPLAKLESTLQVSIDFTSDIISNLTVYRLALILSCAMPVALQ